MRVLALTNLYPNPFQMNRAPYNKRQFANLGRMHDVRVISPIAWTDEFRARRAGKPALPRDRRIVRDGLKVEYPRYYYPPKVGRRWYGHFYLRSVARAVRRTLEEFSPDLIYTPWAYPDGWAACRLAREYGLPVVLKCHGSDVLLLDEEPARRGPTLAAVRSADRVIAVSRHMADRLVELGVAPERVRVLYCGVEHDKFFPGSKKDARAILGIPDGPPILLFVGNLLPVKAVDVLLRASATLLRRGINHRLVVIGDGPLRGSLEQQAAAEGLAEIVQFKGVVDNGNLPDWYRAADVVVLPSRSEGVPNVLLEASGCGTPWVASAVGGIPEIVELGRGRLVTPGSAEALADAISGTLDRSPAQPSKGPRTPMEAASELAEMLGEVVTETRPTARALVGAT